MKRIRNQACVAALALLSLSACASAPKAIPAQPDPLMAEISSHAEHVSIALNGLMGQSAMNGGLSQQVPPATFPLERLPADLQVSVEMDWHGELEQAVEAVAAFVGWEFMVVGARPSQPIVVLVSSAGDSAGHLLRSLGQQAGSRANVIVRSPSRTIEVVYR
ncbi:hypothetical protein [Dolichospermum phage Dfl-JY45]